MLPSSYLVNFAISFLLHVAIFQIIGNQYFETWNDSLNSYLLEKQRCNVKNQLNRKKSFDELFRIECRKPENHTNTDPAFLSALKELNVLPKKSVTY